MSLFQSGEFALSNGGRSTFKIECEALTACDWATLAAMIQERVGNFRHVIGVPRRRSKGPSGGEKLAELLNYSAKRDSELYYPRLVVDDVWTTGASMFKYMQPGDAGYVVFARNPIPERYPVRALFTLDAGPRFHKPSEGIAWPIRAVPPANDAVEPTAITGAAVAFCPAAIIS